MMGIAPIFFLLRPFRVLAVFHGAPVGMAGRQAGCKPPTKAAVPVGWVCHGIDGHYSGIQCIWQI